jgi:general secretion pathway protein L
MLSPVLSTEEGVDLRNAWIITDDQGGVRGQGETDFRGLADLIDPSAGWLQQPENIVVAIPNGHVLSLSCEVPGRSVSQIRRALPFVVEEYVTTDIEGMHLASGEIRRGAPVRCNLIERSLLDDWLAILADLHIHPGYLLAETEFLPVANDQVTVLFDGDLALVRTSAQSATVDRDNLGLALTSLAGQRLLLINGDLEPLERARLDATLTIERMPTTGLAGASTLGFLATQTDAVRAGINLLQGLYQPRQRQNPHWARWRPAAGLAAAWLLVALLVNVVQGMFAAQRADQLEAESVALYQEIFPGARVTNVRRQMLAQLGEGGDASRSGLIGNLDNLAGAITSGSSIQSLNFTMDRGELAVDLLIPGFEELDQLKERLAARGGSVDITSAEQQERGVRARVRVRDGGQGA